MRVPQVSERIKEAPAQALRGVFAGIGQVLLIADRLRNKTLPGQQVPQTRAPEPSQTRADPAMPAAATPLDFLLEGSEIGLDYLYLDPSGLAVPDPMPDHDLAFMAIGESEANDPLLRNLTPILRRWPRLHQAVDEAGGAG